MMAWGMKVFQLMIPLMVLSVYGQTINTPCTVSMISSFTPCINFVTGSTSNGTSPTASCCNALKSLTSTSMDCTCLIITASVPVQLPINRTLAISLPRACKMRGVPLQCKASGTPLPAPGPVLLGPSPPPPASSPHLSPKASKAVAGAPAPAVNIIPASSPAPTTSTTGGIRPVLTPPASTASYAYPLPIITLVLIIFGSSLINL